MAELDRSLGNRTRRAAFLTYHAISDTGPAYLHVPPDDLRAPARTAAAARAGRRARPRGSTRSPRVSGPPRRSRSSPSTTATSTTTATRCRCCSEYGFRAIVFVIPPMADAGAPLIWPEVEEDQREHPDVMRSMTWDQIGEMAEAGTEIGAHTMTHPKLSTLRGEELRQELRGLAQGGHRRARQLRPLRLPLRRPRARDRPRRGGRRLPLRVRPAVRRARPRTRASRSRASRSTTATTSAASASSSSRPSGPACCRPSSPPRRAR